MPGGRDAPRREIQPLRSHGGQGVGGLDWKNAKTIHHRGYGAFAVDGEIIKLKSRMR
jgi:hypothetical protein